VSKIHQALKRAQEERSQKETASLSLPLFPYTEGITNGRPGGREPKARAAPARSHLTGKYLHFEDLLRYCAKPFWQPNANAILFSELYRRTQGAEQFRALRHRLYQLRSGSPLKKIVVTSAVAGEGKTFVATNLAQAFLCEPQRKVLLVDGDLCNTSLHLPLGAPVAPGLAEYLRDEASEAEIIQHGQEGNLCFIGGGIMEGEGNASELLSNGRLQKLLDRVGPLFDWVIIDSAPCLSVADAGRLASFADGLILVVRGKSTPAAMVQKAVQELKSKLIGVVLNGVEDSPTYGGDNDYSAGPPPQTLVPAQAISLSTSFWSSIKKSLLQQRVFRASLLELLLLSLAIYLGTRAGARTFWREHAGDSPLPSATWQSTLKHAPEGAVATASVISQLADAPHTERAQDSSNVFTYVVQRNDTMRSLCMSLVGRYDEAVQTEICRLNPDLKDPQHLKTGQEVHLLLSPLKQDENRR